MKYRLLPGLAFCIFLVAGVIILAGVLDNPVAGIVIWSFVLVTGLTWLSWDRIANRFWKDKGAIE